MVLQSMIERRRRNSVKIERRVHLECEIYEDDDDKSPRVHGGFVQSYRRLQNVL